MLVPPGGEGRRRDPLDDGARREGLDHAYVRVVGSPGVGRVGREVRVEVLARRVAAVHVVDEVLAGAVQVEERLLHAAAGAEQLQPVVTGGDHGR